MIRTREEKHTLLLSETMEAQNLIIFNEVQVDLQVQVEDKDNNDANTWYFDNDASNHISRK